MPYDCDKIGVERPLLLLTVLLKALLLAQLHKEQAQKSPY
jgi:hypothetical protein